MGKKKKIAKKTRGKSPEKRAANPPKLPVAHARNRGNTFGVTSLPVALAIVMHIGSSTQCIGCACARDHFRQHLRTEPPQMRFCPCPYTTDDDKLYKHQINFRETTVYMLQIILIMYFACWFNFGGFFVFCLFVCLLFVIFVFWFQWVFLRFFFHMF